MGEPSPGMPSLTKPSLVLLHGFLGSPEDWNETICALSDSFHCIPIDVNGFFTLHSAQDYHSLSSCITEQLSRVSNQKATIIGYSLGARIALNTIITSPGLFDKAVLISCSPGISDFNERAIRAAADRKLSEMILDDFTGFLYHWYASSVFSTLSPYKRKLLSGLRSKNNPVLQSLIIKTMSPGIQKSLWEDLEKLNAFPHLRILLMYGENDGKYKEISYRIHDKLQNSRLECIRDTGHIPQFENFPEFISSVKNFLLDNS